MKARPKMSSLEAHLLTRRRLALARRPAQGQSHVANVMLEVEREIARLDAELLEIERKIAQLSDEQKPQRERFTFWRFWVEFSVNDKRQLRDLVTALKARRDELAGPEGHRALEAAKRLAEHLSGNVPAEAIPDEPPDPPIPPEGSNGHPRGRKWG